MSAGVRNYSWMPARSQTSAIEAAYPPTINLKIPDVLDEEQKQYVKAVSSGWLRFYSYALIYECAFP